MYPDDSVLVSHADVGLHALVGLLVDEDEGVVLERLFDGANAVKLRLTGHERARAFLAESALDLRENLTQTKVI